MFRLEIAKSFRFVSTVQYESSQVKKWLGCYLILLENCSSEHGVQRGSSRRQLRSLEPLHRFSLHHIVNSLVEWDQFHSRRVQDHLRD